MVETSRDWSEKLPFALWAYRTSFRTSTGATPFSLVYGMEVVMPVEIEVGSLRVALEHQIAETDWLRARYDQLNLLDEKRLRAVDHMHAYQRKMVRAFRKRAHTILDIDIAHSKASDCLLVKVHDVGQPPFLEDIKELHNAFSIRFGIDVWDILHIHLGLFIQQWAYPMHYHVPVLRRMMVSVAFS
ncbi:hypothetical protein AAG906_020698 [Vitis piasezkii]